MALRGEPLYQAGAADQEAIIRMLAEQETQRRLLRAALGCLVRSARSDYAKCRDAYHLGPLDVVLGVVQFARRH